MLDLDLYGKVISFDVYPVATLGDVYKKVKVLAIVDYDTARLFSDVETTANNVYSTLPVGTPKDAKNYRYLKLRSQNGAISCVALEWINQSTIVVHDEVYVNAKIRLRSIEDTESIRKVLIANGLDLVSIEHI